MLREVLRLPFPTSDCDIGPVAEHRPGEALIRYDAEDPTGIVWTELSFRMVVAVRFTPDAACDEWMIEAYSKVCEIEGGDWLEGLCVKAHAGGQMVAASARHFVVYFDHVGCWEVLADDVVVQT